MKLIKIIIYLKNRFPTKSLLNTIPWESFYGEKSDFFNFRIIGLFVYCHNIEIENDLNRLNQIPELIR
jgi:hypothetical protein